MGSQRFRSAIYETDPDPDMYDTENNVFMMTSHCVTTLNRTRTRTHYKELMMMFECSQSMNAFPLDYVNTSTKLT